MQKEIRLTPHPEVRALPLTTRMFDDIHSLKMSFFFTYGLFEHIY